MGELHTNGPTAAAKPSRGRRVPPWLRFVGECVVLAGWLAAPCSVLGWLGGHVAAFDLFTPFHLQYAVVLLTCCGVAGLLRAKCSLVVLAVGALVSVSLVAPLWVQPAQPSGAGPSVRVMQANVLTSNRGYAALLAQVEAARPDVLVTQEVDAAWVDALHGLSAVRVASAVPREDNFGMAVWVSDRVEVVEVRESADGLGLPILVCEFAVEGERFRVVVTHPVPPIGHERRGVRDATLAHAGRLARAAGDAGRPVLIVGDLNATRWSKPMRQLRRGRGLRDSSRGFGPQGTWPARLWFTGMIGIDHVLVSPAWRVEDRRVLDDNGSDHRAVLVDLVLAGL